MTDSSFDLSTLEPVSKLGFRAEIKLSFLDVAKPTSDLAAKGFQPSAERRFEGDEFSNKRRVGNDA